MCNRNTIPPPVSSASTRRRTVARRDRSGHQLTGVWITLRRAGEGLPHAAKTNEFALIPREGRHVRNPATGQAPVNITDAFSRPAYRARVGLAGTDRRSSATRLFIRVARRRYRSTTRSPCSVRKSICSVCMGSGGAVNHPRSELTSTVTSTSTGQRKATPTGESNPLR